LGIEKLGSTDCAYACKTHADNKLIAIQPDYRVVTLLHEQRAGCSNSTVAKRVKRIINVLAVA
jgi:hypothetical protein